MKKKGAAAATAEQDESTGTNSASVVDKGCLSTDWKEEYWNQRCVALLRWMMGRV